MSLSEGEARALSETMDQRIERKMKTVNGRQITLPPAVFHLPESNVHNDVAAPDLAPIADALDRMTGALAEQSRQIAALIEALRQQKPPTVEVSPAVKAPAVEITLTTEAIAQALRKPLDELVEALTAPKEATRRRLRVAHADGTESIIEEQ